MQPGTRLITIARIVTCLAIGGLVTGCSFGNSTDGSCLLSVTTDSGSGVVLDSSHEAAQSFVISSGSQTVSSIAIKLKAYSSDGVTKPNGTLNVALYSDSATNSTTPTSPSSILGGTSNYGTISGSNLSLTTAQFITVALPSPQTLSTGAYWVYISSTQGVSTTLQILWEKSTTDSYTKGFPWYYGTGALSGFDLLTELGC